MNNHPSIIKIIMVLLLSFPLKDSIHAQDTITGTIKSTQDDTPVEFIHISVKNTPKGTITRFDGTFALHLKKFSPGLVLVISGIGYHTKEIQLDAFPRDSLEIKIKQKQYAIEEVEFKRRQLLDDPKKIVRKAIKNIDNNYSPEPYVMEGFYQDIFQDYDTYKNVSFATKNVTIHSPSFDSVIKPGDVSGHSVSQLDSFWSKVYYDNDNMMLPQYEIPNYGGNHLLCLLNHDPVRNHERENMSFINGLGKGLFSTNDFMSNHEFRLYEVGYYNGKRAYFIDIQIKEPIWRSYINILDEYLINNNGLRFNGNEFYPSFSNGITVLIYIGQMVVNTEDFAIMRLEYHNGYLHDRYKLAVEYQKSDKYYYPTNIYLGNKCFVNPSHNWSIEPEIDNGTIQCLGGLDYFKEIKHKYAISRQNKSIIKQIMNDNTLHTPNTRLIKKFYQGGSQIEYYYQPTLTAYSKAMEDILYAFKLKEYDKLLHHRMLRINKVYKPSADTSGNKSLISGQLNTEFQKTFKYMGDPNYSWYAYAQGDTGPFNFISFNFNDHYHSITVNGITYDNYYFSGIPIPVTSVDEYRYLYKIPKLPFLTDKNYLMKGYITIYGPYYNYN